MFGLTGSDANETAFRLARMYHTIRGESKRTKIISRKYSYHGFTKAALGATRLPCITFGNNQIQIYILKSLHMT